MAADPRPTPPEREPLLYFGNWCGQGWSARHTGSTPLTPRDMKTPAALVINRFATSRESPIDLACKQHDIAYNAIDQQRDPYRASTMKLMADKRLLADIGSLVDRNNAGGGDLNMGEVLYARNVQIAFRTVLVLDGLSVAYDLTSRVERQGRQAIRAQAGRAAHNAIDVAGRAAPYVMVLLLPTPLAAARLVRLAVPPRR